jgi:glycosyltransferase involved in cell wall biosynthesis
VTGAVRLLTFCGATTWGGAEIVLGHLLGELDERFDVHLLGVHPAILERLAARRPGMSWTVVPAVRSKRDVAAMWSQRRHMARTSPDIVQLNLPAPSADRYSVLAALTLARTPVVAIEHLPMGTSRRGAQRLVRWTAPRLAAVVGVSSRAAQQIEQLVGLPSGAVRVVPNGVPDPAPRQPLPVPPGPLVIGAIGRMHRHKGFDVLLHALVALQEVQLVLIGDGRERPALEQLVRDLGLGRRVSMLGWSDDASGQLRSFDILAVPSRSEGLPLVLLEGMFAGVPIVATTVGGVPDAVEDGRSALLVPPDDVAALTSALRRLGADDPLRRRLGAAAQEEARARFTVEAMARSYEDLYDELLARRPPAG